MTATIVKTIKEYALEVYKNGKFKYQIDVFSNFNECLKSAIATEVSYNEELFITEIEYSEDGEEIGIETTALNWIFN